MDWNSPYIDDLLKRALEEDLGSGDATTAAVVPLRASAVAHILARQTLVCAGLPMAERVFRSLIRRSKSPACITMGRCGSRREDREHQGKCPGNSFRREDGAEFSGASLRNCNADAAVRRATGGNENAHSGYEKNHARPAALEKYAVKTGGGSNHRIGLYDAILLKETTLPWRGEIKAALDRRIRMLLPKCRRRERPARTMQPD